MSLSRSVSLRQFFVVAALGLASVTCSGMAAARVYSSGTGRYLFLVWNLLLAWIPMGAALVAYNARRRWRLRWAVILPWALLWLLFFPNAPYVVTDLFHLQWVDGFPVWYDAIMLAAFAWTSFMLGFTSLHLMHSLVAQAAGKLTGWLFAFSTLGLSAFGIYLGRFLRWNSWDVFLRPAALLLDVWDRLRHPLSHPRTLAFSTMLTAFLVMTYLILVAFSQLPQEAHGTVRD